MIVDDVAQLAILAQLELSYWKIGNSHSERQNLRIHRGHFTIGTGVASSVPEHRYVPELILEHYNYHKKASPRTSRTIDCVPLSNDTFDAQLLRDDHGRLLSDDQRGRVSVRSDIGRADGQICNFESLDAIHIEARIDNAALFARFHRASPELAKSKTKEGGQNSLAHVYYRPKTHSHKEHVTKRRDESKRDWGLTECHPVLTEQCKKKTESTFHQCRHMKKTKRKLHVPLLRTYASSARSSSSEYTIRGVSNAIGPSACATTEAGLPGANSGCRTVGSPRK